MKISKHIFLLMLFIIAGCQDVENQSKKQGRSGTKKSTGTESVKKYSSVLNHDSTVINNEFSHDVLAFEVFKADTNKIKSLFLSPAILKIEKKRDAEGDPYFLYNFTDGINRLTLYNNDGFYLEDADIRNNNVLLKKISVGMTKNAFLDLISRADIKRDTIIVKDDELSFEAVYIFNNSKLKQIRLGQIVE